MDIEKFFNISYRDIINILNIVAPVIFTPQDQLDRGNDVFLKFMGEAEETARLNGSYSETVEYDTSDVGLHFPDITIREHMNLEKNRNPYVVDDIIKKCSCAFKIYLSETHVIYAVHCVLHEYGHWKDFIESGKSAYEFSVSEKEARQNAARIASEIYKMPDRDPLKKILANEYNRDVYSQIPSEKAADKYVDEHMIESLEKVRQALGYTEDDLFQLALRD